MSSFGFSGWRRLRRCLLSLLAVAAVFAASLVATVPTAHAASSVSSVQVVPGATQVAVAWARVAGATSYRVEVATNKAITKSRKTVAGAERGYKEINLRALKLLPRGGYFATASCSHFMPSELFVKMLKSAAADAGVELRQIEARQQAPDHPILWNVPETDYLKFYIFQVV